MKILLMILLLLASGFAQADIYQCIGSHGEPSYSDQPCTPSDSMAASEHEVLGDDFSKVNALFTKIPWAVGKHIYAALFFLYLGMSIICFYAYRRDKRFAQTGQRRIPESSLHALELLGGWPGGFLAQRIVRHKNKKLSYQLVFWLIASLHIAAVVDSFMLNHAWLNQIKAFALLS